MKMLWRQVFLFCVLISACYTDTAIIINVHCQNNTPDGCHIRERLSIHINTELNFVDAAAWNNAIHFKISSESNVTIMPTGIFQRFKKLSEIQITTGLQTLQTNQFKDAHELMVLDLSGNQLKMIPGHVFTEAVRLEEIVLSQNQINTVEDHAFNGLSNLQYIYLNDNLLTILSANTFAGAENLLGLSLENNKIETIEDGALNLAKLKSIFLSNNRIRRLSDNVFAGASNLFGLTIAANQLETIGQSLYHLIKLNALILDQNRIEDIDLNALARLPGLLQISLRESGFKFGKSVERAVARSSKVTFLDISKNKLSDSDVLQRLAMFTQLEELKMEENNLSAIDGIDRVKGAFPRLARLGLSGNRLTCDQTQTIVQTLRTQHVVVGAADNSDILDSRKHFKGINCL